VGIEQSRQAGIELKQLLQNENKSFTLILSSLRRALQTADHMPHASGLRPSKTIVVPAAAEVMRDSCDNGTPASLLRQDFPHLSSSLEDIQRIYEYSLDFVSRRRRLSLSVARTQ